MSEEVSPEIKQLQKEVAFYKKRLDELTGENVKLDYTLSGMRQELKQRRQAFALVSTLLRLIAVQTNLSDIIQSSLDLLSSGIGMDRTILFTHVPGSAKWRVSAERGFGDAAVNVLGLEFEIPEEFASGAEIMIANQKAPVTEFMSLLREKLGVPFFLLAGIATDTNREGLVLTGRLQERPPLYPALDTGDADALKVITSLLAAIAQNIQTRSKQEYLQKELAVQTATAEISRKVQNLVDNMSQALFSVDRNLTIVEPVSKFSSKVFGTEVAGSNVMDVVYKDVKRESEVFGKLNTALLMSFGEGDMQWDFVRDDLPAKVEYQGADGTRILSIKHAPLWDKDELLDQLMYVVEDITENELLAKKIEEQRAQSQIIEQLIEVERGDLVMFFNGTNKIIASSRKMNSQLDDPDSFPVLMRELHTLKGNARLYNFKLISECVHEIEGNVLKIKQDYLDGALTIEDAERAVSLDLDQVDSVVQSYVDTASRFMGLNEKSGGQTETVHSSNLKRLEAAINELVKVDPKSDVAVTLQKRYQELLYVPLKSDLIKFTSMVDEIAQRLGKKVKFNVVGDEVALSTEKLSVLKDMLTHIIRNSLDHGLELPEERLANGKSEEGTITIEFREAEGGVYLEAIDDGRGMDPQKIAESAVRKKIIEPDVAATLSDEEKLSLIFVPGFSTKQEATDLSGRGVGMNIVKDSVERINGKLALNSEVNVGTRFSISL